MKIINELIKITRLNEESTREKTALLYDLTINLTKEELDLYSPSKVMYTDAKSLVQHVRKESLPNRMYHTSIKEFMAGELKQLFLDEGLEDYTDQALTEMKKLVKEAKAINATSMLVGEERHIDEDYDDIELFTITMIVAPEDDVLRQADEYL